MAIEKSLGLSQKLEECEQIARIYSQQSDDSSMQSHYLAIADAVAELNRAHKGSRIFEAISIRFYARR